MKDIKYNRRNFLHKYLKAGSMLAGAGLVLSYSSLSSVAKELAQSSSSNQQPPKKAVQPAQKNQCDNLSGVSAEEIEKRKKLAYVTKTPIPDSMFIQLVGPQRSTATNVTFAVDAASTAIAGTDYTIVTPSPVVIPAFTSGVKVRVTISRVTTQKRLIFNLTGGDNVTPSANFKVFTYTLNP